MKICGWISIGIHAIRSFAEGEEIPLADFVHFEVTRIRCADQQKVGYFWKWLLFEQCFIYLGIINNGKRTFLSVKFCLYFANSAPTCNFYFNQYYDKLYCRNRWDTDQGYTCVEYLCSCTLSNDVYFEGHMVSHFSFVYFPALLSVSKGLSAVSLSADWGTVQALWGVLCFPSGRIQFQHFQHVLYCSRAMTRLIRPLCLT